MAEANLRTMTTGRRLMLGALLVGCGSLQTAALAETADERLQRLENEIRELRELLIESRKTAAPAAPAAVAPLAPVQAPTAAPAVVAPTDLPAGQLVPVQRGVTLRYFISSEAMGNSPPRGLQPLTEGRFQTLDSLSFDPADYDVADSGYFSRYRDPVTYPHVGLALEGQLPVQFAGDYEFVVYPKPAKEGGSSMGSSMTVQMRVDGATVIESVEEKSWRPLRGRVQLTPGWHHIELWAVAIYDGVGPQPTDSHVGLALKGPGDARPRTMEGLLIPTAGN